MNNGATGAIAIGFNGNNTTGGSNSIALGSQLYNRPHNSIVLNATNVGVTGVTGGFCVNPINGELIGNNQKIGYLFYDVSINEIRYNLSAKTFIINHPNDKDRYLIHACLEGPENGVYYRGNGEIKNNTSTKIVLPDYVKNLAYDFTIQITPIYSGKKLIIPLQVSEMENSEFYVYGENSKFYWVVYGKRSEIQVEPLKNSINIKGNGPYQWVEINN